MNRNLFKKAVNVFFVIFIFTHSLSGFADKKRLNITGSSSVAPLILEIAKRYESSHPGVRIDVQTGGSSRGINDARKGLADIGMVSRSPKENENDLTFHTVATDGITMILHKSNPVKSLSDQQIIDIYTGKINRWSQIGGPDKSITVINKAEGRSTLEVFLAYVDLKNSDIKASVVIGDNQQAIKTVIGNPGAIAYVSIGAAEYEENFGASIKRLPIAGIPATTKSLMKGLFPISRSLNVVTKGELTPLTTDFIAFARSSQVDDLIKNQFLVTPKR